MNKFWTSLVIDETNKMKQCFLPAWLENVREREKGSVPDASSFQPLNMKYFTVSNVKLRNSFSGVGMGSKTDGF